MRTRLFELSTEVVDKSVSNWFLKDLTNGFYYSFVKLDQLYTINISFNIQLVTILVSPYSMLCLIILIDTRR